ncbi:MAG: MauE/DoxX family redox-associated membrane protein [Bacteroidota bacterium]
MGLPPDAWKAASVALLALMFVGAGVMHFVRPRMFEAIVPPSLPWPRTAVLVSGVAEIAGGVGLLVEPLREVAGWALAAMLLAFLPVHVYMLREADRFADLAPRWALWARLPLQFVLVGWVVWAATP